MIRNDFFMRKAIELAKSHNPSPNPRVGAVIVKNGEIIGVGAHVCAGTPHAEINALNDAKKDVSGAALYVTLEPCSHFGKTPPCTDAIIKSGIKKVYIGMVDCDGKVCGRGIQKLIDAGVEVEYPILEDECRAINTYYIKHRSCNKPYVIIKSAMTIDGKTAAASGDSKWITNEKSRAYVHEIRNTVDAILVGGNTFRIDNPSLNVRIPDNPDIRNPIKIVITSDLDVDLNANIFKSSGDVILAYFDGESETIKTDNIYKVHCEPDRLDLFLQKLADMGICSLLIEGGAGVSGWFLKENLFDELICFYAPKIACDANAKSAFIGANTDKMSDCINVEIKEIMSFDGDFAIKAYPIRENK